MFGIDPRMAVKLYQRKIKFTRITSFKIHRPFFLHCQRNSQSAFLGFGGVFLVTAWYKFAKSFCAAICARSGQRLTEV